MARWSWTVSASTRSSATGDRVTGVVAQGAHVSTPLVVNCAGPYAATVGALAAVDVPVKPFRRHLFLTETFALDHEPPMTVDVATSFYFHREGDGRCSG